MNTGKKEKIGEYFIRKAELSFEQAEMILQQQQREPHKRFGEVALELGFIGYEQMQEYLREQDELSR